MGAYLSLSLRGREVWRGGRLFEAGRLLNFSAFRMGAYSRWALIRGWALIRINTVYRSVNRHGHHCHSSPLAEEGIRRRTAARAHFLVINKGAGQFYLSSDTR